MGDMDRDDAYDWVDDETLDLDTTMRRFEQLQPICVSTAPRNFGIVAAAATSTDAAATIIKPLLGPQRQAANFA